MSDVFRFEIWVHVDPIMFLNVLEFDNFFV